MGFDLNSVSARLPDRRIDWFPSVTSTMTLAARAARDGAPSGTVIGADGQVAGIGRHGHSWHSEAEAGLYVSIILRPPIGLAADLRWPNDVMISGKKCAGILAQLEMSAIVAGIGINVNHMEFPVEVAPLATSLRLEGKRSVSREDLLVALLQSIDKLMKILTERGAPAILDRFTRASSYARGRRVRVEQNGAIIEGTTCGLDASGFLVVREDNGKETTILAGGVRPV
jgi:BirA family biotin operon repressor/biotin-[acetyl-CoA-carboxylase] ligase